MSKGSEIPGGSAKTPSTANRRGWGFKNPLALSLPIPPSGGDDDGSGPRAEDALAGATYSGALVKKSDWKHEWRERHLVLNESTLYNFKTLEPTSTRAHDVLDLSVDSSAQHTPPHTAQATATVAAAEGGGGGGHSPPAAWPHAFAVTSAGGSAGGVTSWALGAASAEGAAAWVELINAAVADLKLKARYEAELFGMLRRGAVFVKYHNDALGNFMKKDRRRRVELDRRAEHLEWAKITPAATKTAEKDGAVVMDRMPVASMKRVVSGKQTAAFLGSSNAKADPHKCLSLIGTDRTLDLVAESQQVRDDWVDGLTALIKFGADSEAAQALRAQASMEQRLGRAGSTAVEARHAKERAKASHFKALLEQNKARNYSRR